MLLTIGEKIALLRKRKNISQTELAQYLFLTPQTVSRWESGGGTPDIALLPKIAVFFGVSIDELFGLTSMERAADLAAKYSVLRDDGSFREAMDYIDSQLQALEAALKGGLGDPAELRRELDRLEGEKLHMWIQLGRESFQRALSIAETFIEKTRDDPEDPWYLPMRLQYDQLCVNIGKGREALAERERDFAQRPDAVSLLRYISLLVHRQEYETALKTALSGGPSRELLFPPSKESLPVWDQLIRAAAETGDTAFIEEHLPPVLELCGKEEELWLLMSLLGVYQGGQLAALKERLLSQLPKAGLNQYFEERAREQIELA